MNAATVLNDAIKEQAQRCQQAALQADAAIEALLWMPAYTRKAQGFGHTELERLERERDQFATCASVWLRGCWVTVEIVASVADGWRVSLAIGEG